MDNELDCIRTTGKTQETHERFSLMGTGVWKKCREKREIEMAKLVDKLDEGCSGGGWWQKT